MAVQNSQLCTDCTENMRKETKIVAALWGWFFLCFILFYFLKLSAIHFCSKIGNKEVLSLLQCKAIVPTFSFLIPSASWITAIRISKCWLAPLAFDSVLFLSNPTQQKQNYFTHLKVLAQISSWCKFLDWRALK